MTPAKYSIECKPDKTLLNMLGISKKLIIHSGNKSRVLKYLEKNSNSIGLVDEDPNSLENNKLNSYNLIKTFDTDILLLEKRNSNNVLIILRPRLEEWIIKASKDAKIDLEKYGLPNDGKELKKVINYKLSNYTRLLSDLNESRYIDDLKVILNSKLDLE